MKKIFFLLLCFYAALCFCPAYGAENGKLNIVATIFPEYDWVKSILGDAEANVTLLLDNGIDMHSYQPTVDDMVKIANCDLFIYVGGESDGWVEDALKNSVNKNQTALNLLHILGSSVKDEEIVEGMEHDLDHHEHDHNNDEEPETDEHVWLSLKNAEVLCREIAGTLAKLDPAHKEAYTANAARYIDELSELDREYRAAVDSAARRVVLFGDRFPFRYLADDYGLKYYAAFSGCSAETEASFETVMFLAGKVDELNLPCILTIEGTRHRIAETIKSNTKLKNQQVLSMNSMQSTTSKDAEGGASYLSVMRENLVTLKSALN